MARGVHELLYYPEVTAEDHFQYVQVVQDLPRDVYEAIMWFFNQLPNELILHVMEFFEEEYPSESSVEYSCIESIPYWSGELPDYSWEDDYSGED